MVMAAGLCHLGHRQAQGLGAVRVLGRAITCGREGMSLRVLGTKKKKKTPIGFLDVFFGVKFHFSFPAERQQDKYIRGRL